MAMSGAYGAYNNSLLTNSNYLYKSIVDDANSKRVLVENIDKLWKDYRSEYWWWHQQLFEEKSKAGKWCFEKIKTHELKPNEANLSAIPLEQINKCCDNYSTLINTYRKIAAELASVKENLGSKHLHVDGKSYDIRIDEAISLINTSIEKMEEFVSAVQERGPFLHDFQKCVQIDYCRYYGRAYYGARKCWNRTKDGWDI